jgi:CBS domain-containing protein
MRAKDVMGRARAAKKAANCRDVALKLLSEEYSSLPVVEDDGSVVGVISELDILKAIRDGKKLEDTSVDELMSHNPQCVDTEMPVEQIIDLMAEMHLIRVPVVKAGKLAGSISRSNILDSYVSVEFKESFWVLRG